MKQMDKFDIKPEEIAVGNLLITNIFFDVSQNAKK